MAENSIQNRGSIFNVNRGINDWIHRTSNRTIIRRFCSNILLMKMGSPLARVLKNKHEYDYDEFWLVLLIVFVKIPRIILQILRFEFTVSVRTDFNRHKVQAVSRRLGFDLRSGLVGFMVSKVVLGKVLSEYFRLPCTKLKKMVEFLFIFACNT
jgi:hypothetical protein